MKQTERLYNALLTETVTPLSAWSNLGIYRLSDAVYKLRKQGHTIITNNIEVENRFGEKCLVAEYELIIKT